MGNFPFAEIEGTPYEIGFQHGSLFREQVLRSIACYRSMFLDYSDLEWSRARELSRRFEPVIRDYNPDYLEEIRGVADGAGLDFEDILALNCRSELVFVGSQMDQCDGGCTSIGVIGEAAAGGHACIAHNWDWKTVQREAMVMMRIRQKNGRPTILMVTEAGIIGKTGFNSAGVCLFLNALSTNEPARGLPIHIAMRGIMDCETLAEAITAATRMPLGCCANFMLGHDEDVISLEIENGDFDVLYPTDGILVHTNHFVSPRLPHYPRVDTTKAKFPDTFVRLGRADRRLRRIGKDITVQNIMEVLRDHGEYPCSICRHDDPKAAPGLRIGTVFSMTVDLKARTVWFCKGNPCELPYEVYRVE